MCIRTDAEVEELVEAMQGNTVLQTVEIYAANKTQREQAQAQGPKPEPQPCYLKKPR